MKDAGRTQPAVRAFTPVRVAQKMWERPSRMAAEFYHRAVLCADPLAPSGLTRSQNVLGSALGVTDPGADHAILAAIAVAVAQRRILREPEPRRGRVAKGPAGT